MITVIGDTVVDIIVSKDKTNYATDTDGIIHFRPGGQAFNVASYIGREGVECQFIGKVGDDPFGTYLIEEMKKRGVTPVVTKLSNEKTGTIILLIENESGERSMITDRGANLYLSEQDIQGIENSTCIYLSGYSLFSETTKKVATFAKQQAIRYGIPIALDPSSTYFLKQHKDEFLNFAKGSTFFFPNYDEGMLLTEEKEPKNILNKLHKYVQYPILTMGEKGCCFYYNEQFHEITPPSVNVVDTTAAGDSFVGAFLATYFNTNNFLQAAKYAVEVSAKTVTFFGSLPEK